MDKQLLHALALRLKSEAAAVVDSISMRRHEWRTAAAVLLVLAQFVTTEPQSVAARAADGSTGAGQGACESAVGSMVELIEKKRDGGELTAEEIWAVVSGFHNGVVPDYQMSAMLMAMYIRGMTAQETTDMTVSFMKTGEIADLSSLGATSVDKHSTGGVGDKVSLALAPLVASFGVIVPMMSGRGLGHTGGTLDKLESLPGVSTALTSAQFMQQLRDIGVAISGPTETIAPVDRALYALRDATGTAPSLPLIVSSIMSKKLAEGPDCLLLDVKTGDGAFLPAWEDAHAMAQAMLARVCVFCLCLCVLYFSVCIHTYACAYTDTYTYTSICVYMYSHVHRQCWRRARAPARRWWCS